MADMLQMPYGREPRTDLDAFELVPGLGNLAQLDEAGRNGQQHRHVCNVLLSHIQQGIESAFHSIGRITHQLSVPVQHLPPATEFDSDLDRGQSQYRIPSVILKDVRAL